MKTLTTLQMVIGLLATTALNATAAQACPDLSGTYFCNANTAHPDMYYTFAQTPRPDGTWQYKMGASLTNGKAFSGFTFTTDGNEQDVIDEVSGDLLKVTASCDSTALTVTGLTALDKPKPIKFSEILSLTPEGDLYDISININGDTVHETCYRQ